VTPAAEAGALARDAADPGHRDLFHIPPWNGRPADVPDIPDVAYFAGNSLGLQPKATADELDDELSAWQQLAVEGHLEAVRPWFSYHEPLAGPAARLVGALPSEVVAMNSLTVNLHLLMVSFYRPAGERTRVVIEDHAFPSDSYAVRSQARFHGLDPDATVVRLRPRHGEDCLRADDVADFLAGDGATVALVLLGGVNYLTGELLDIPAITAAARAAGAVVGWDLAHAVGNVPLDLHDWDVDFAAWCTYKYLNAGPGAVAGVFVHERHHPGGTDVPVPRLEGWWSTDAASRFEMAPVATPPASADAWQVSNPPILAMSPVRTSLELFDRVGIDTLRERSVRLTGYLEELLDDVIATRPVDAVTPRDPARRGAQLSLRLRTGGVDAVAARLRADFGVIADTRRPDIIRLAPAPLYSTYHDCWRATTALARIIPEQPTR